MVCTLPCGRLITFADQIIGKMRINGLATLFRIAQNTSNIAIQTFKMAVTMNFVQGRRLEMVAAACLYTACRKDDAGCPYMLIDFADKIGVISILGSLSCPVIS